MKHLPTKQRKKALQYMAENYAERRVADDAARGDLGPLMEGFEDGYRQAMKDVRKIVNDLAATHQTDLNGRRLAIGYRAIRWAKPLR